MFCPECSSLMKSEDGKLVCRNCGFERKVKDEDHEPITTQKKEKERVVIEEEVDTLPTTNERCPECGNTEAYWRLEQTRAADEPETRIYRCTECNHTWREY